MRARRRGGEIAAVLLAGALLATVAAPAAPSADARYLYVNHEGTSSLYKEGGIVAMSIGADGKLTKGPVLGPEVVGQAGYAGLAIPPGGRHLFPAAWAASVLTGMTINADGSLKGDANSSQYSVFSPWGVSAAPDGRFVFVGNGDPANVSAFDVSSGAPNIIDAYPAGSQPRGVATTPDGAHVYVANQKSNNISAYSVGANGALTHVADIPLPAGPPAAEGPSGIVISPDGRYLYSANEISGNISGFSVEASGLLLPIGTFPSTDGALSNLALSPDGRHLFAAQGFGNLVVAFNVGQDGSVAQVGAGVSTGAEASSYSGIAVTPDGRYVYVTASGFSYAGKVAAFAVQPSGALVGVLGSPFPTGLSKPDYQSLAIAPDQSPVPAFTAAPAKKGNKVSFDGAGSSDPDGTVARYDWDFGDGATAVDGGSAPAHAYAHPGRYTVSLSVVDDEGCSTRLVYTGQTASCSGSTLATQAIMAGRLKLTLSGAKVQALSAKGLVLRAKCNIAACRVKARAVVKGLGLKTKRASARAAKAGRRARLKLRFKSGDLARLEDALAGGGRIKARVTASAKAEGFSAKTTRTVLLNG